MVENRLQPFGRLQPSPTDRQAWQEAWEQLTAGGWLESAIEVRNHDAVCDLMIVHEELGRQGVQLSILPAHFTLAALSLSSSRTGVLIQEWIGRILAAEVVPAIMPISIERRLPDAERWTTLLAAPNTTHVFVPESGYFGIHVARVDQLHRVFRRQATGVSLVSVDVSEVETVGEYVPLHCAEDVPSFVEACGRLMVAAQIVAGARYVLTDASQYAASRKQFGKPIAAFQAVRHRLADSCLEVDSAERLVWRASAMAQESTTDFCRVAKLAKASAELLSSTVVFTAHQVLAATGYIVEHPLHRFTEDLALLSSVLRVDRSELQA
jgi:alkylation response protein AidB-like acyl-CoA dehydrogenase